MQKKYLYFIAAIHLCNDISSGAVPAILPFFVLYYGMDYASMAGLVFASSFLASIIQPLFGYFADRTSKLWFMALGVFMTGTCLGLTGFVTDYWSIFLAVTGVGIGSSIFHPEAARLVNHIAGKQKASAMSIFSVGGNGGFGLGPLLAVAMITTLGMKGLAVFAIIGILMGLAAFILVPKIKNSAEKKLQEATPASATAVETQPTNNWNAFGRLTLLITFRAIVFTGLSSFLPIYCIQVLGASHSLSTATLSVLSFSGIIMTLIGGYFADRVGYVSILRICSILLVPFLFFCFFGGSIWWVYGLLLPISLTLYSTYSPFVVLGQTYLAKNIGFASGVTLGLSFSIGGIAAPILGHVGDLYGLETVMMLIVCSSILCAIATFLLPKTRTK